MLVFRGASVKDISQHDLKSHINYENSCTGFLASFTIRQKRHTVLVNCPLLCWMEGNWGWNVGEISHEEIDMFVLFVFLYVSPHKSKLDIYNILLALPHWIYHGHQKKTAFICFFLFLVQGLNPIDWVVPLPSNNHHQDDIIFLGSGIPT